MRRILAMLYTTILLLLAGLLLWPAGELILAIRDPRLSGPEPAVQASRWHRAMTPAFAAWAEQRRSSDVARHLPIHDISGTEWPLFGALFYLRATENLDLAWQETARGTRPAQYARRAIDAAAELLADPAQADWVMRHWGEERYLRHQNVFYRMLLIDGLATQWRLLGSSPHADLLREQVVALAAELSDSETGLLADYPGQTFPADVAAAWHAIRRADPVLGTDHSALVQQGLRGFVGAMAPRGDLPPYAWFGDDGARPTQVRGCANTWLLHHAPFLWPDQARGWSAANDAGYWQDSRWLVGYREFARNESETGRGDVDSGPIVAGLGAAASAFGIGAARSVGDGAKARALSLQAIAASWPLPNGRLLFPRLLSDLAHAPLLGEAALLYNLSQPAAPQFSWTSPPPRWRDVPRLVLVVLVVQLLLGLLALRHGLRRSWKRSARLHSS